MDLSVIIPVYNAAALIDRCLDSVFSQQGEYQIEVICVDDGSTDNSVELIKGRREQNIVLLQQENVGPAAARNRGMRVAKGRYMAYLDADDYWLPGFIEKAISFLDSHLECIAVTVGQRHITVSGTRVLPEILKVEQLNIPSQVLEDFYSFWLQHNHVCTGSIVIRTDIAQKTGGQREDLRICEDLEFWAYLATYGKFGFIPEVLFVSDGSKVTETIGWVEKHIKRWNAAVPIACWEQRLVERLSVALPKAYTKIRGNISQNLSYSILLSKRYDLAREQVLKYGKDFPQGKMKTLLTNAARCSLTWFVISRLLVYREYHRK